MPATVKRREIDRAIAAALIDAGYQQKRGTFFLKPIATEVNGWVSYFSQRVGADIEITPTVGVRHERIHQLIDRLEDRKGDPTEPTATIILGYLMPENTANVVWRFDTETPMDEQAQNIAEHVARYAEPWMREHSSPESIIDEVRANRVLQPARLPVALLLAGRADEAQAALNTLLDDARNRIDEVAEDFRRFAERFRSELLAPASAREPTTSEG